MVSRRWSAIAITIALGAVLLLGAFGCASRKPAPTPSESLTYRGQQEWSRGNYASAYTLYRRAYDRALLYADLQEQGDALLNLAELSLKAMRYTVADSVLKSVPPEALNDEETVAQRELIAWKIGAARGNCDGLAESRRGGVWEARVQLAVASCGAERGDLEGARRAVERAEELFGKTGAGQIAGAKGVLALASGDSRTAIRLFEEALAAAQQARHPYAIGEILYNLGLAAETAGDSERAAREYDRALKVFDRVGVKIPYLKAAQGWLRTASEVTEGQRQAFDAAVKAQAGADLDAALARRMF